MQGSELHRDWANMSDAELYATVLRRELAAQSATQGTGGNRRGTAKDTLTFECPLCSEIFITKSKWSNHKDYQCAKRPDAATATLQTATCPHCKKVYNGVCCKKNMQKHVKNCPMGKG